MKRKKAKKKPRAKFKDVTVTINLGREHRQYVEEIASYACTSVDLVCAVMMATGIFQAKRFRVPEKMTEMQNQLQRARQVMEANDPTNARDIFGPPTVAEAAPAASPDPARVPDVAP